MNKFLKFLEEFEIDKQTIKQFIDGRQILISNSNVFLSKNNLEKNEVYKEELIFIQLREFLPSKYLLNFIGNNSVKLVCKTEKKAFSFTYFKDLHPKDFVLRFKEKSLGPSSIKDGRKYIVAYNDIILGIGKYDIKVKTLFNIMNIGEYLKEEKFKPK